MSADNGVYVLRTICTRKQIRFGYGEKTDPYYVYRVAIASAIDNFDWYKRNQPYNLGAYMVSIWRDSPLFDDISKAIKCAQSLEAELPVCEYGVCFIDTEYVFYGDM